MNRSGITTHTGGKPPVAYTTPFTMIGLEAPEAPIDIVQPPIKRRSYSVLIFSSLSRLAVMDSSTELVPLIHAPPSRRRSSGKGP